MAYCTIIHPDGTKSIVSGGIGHYIFSASPNPPKHCLPANGAAIGRAAYPKLYAEIGDTYGAGDGSTTFNLPDARGNFFRGTGGNAAALGVAQGDATRNITGFFGSFGSSNDGSQAGGAFKGITVGYTGYGNIGYQVNMTFDTSYVVPVAVENRPVNISCNIYIIYE